MNHILTRSLSFIPYLPANLRKETYQLDADSFFYRVFNANIETANDVVNTAYLQAMKIGELDPLYYGSLTVLDSYYCYKAADTLKSLLCKIDNREEKEMYQLVSGMADSYDDYNRVFLDSWHLRQSDSVTPTETMYGYAEHEHNVMCSNDPIYTLVSYIPCYYLWPWFSKQIMENKDYSPGVYADWFSGNYYGEGSFDSALNIGEFIDKWQKHGKAFDEKVAFDIYKKSMDYELKVFTEAYNKTKKIMRRK